MSAKPLSSLNGGFALLAMLVDCLAKAHRHCLAARRIIGLSIYQPPVLFVGELEMFWIILAVLIVTGAIVILVVALSHVGDEPGAHRFDGRPHQDEGRR